MKKKNVFLGLTIILIGVLVVLIDLNVVFTRDIIYVGLIVILIGIIIDGISRKNFYEIIMPIAGIYAMAQRYFMFYKLSLITIFLVGILFSLGLSIMF
ncbi:MAG: LiaF transmembrane domain-containing protein, partial [Sarcina sp.]